MRKPVSYTHIYIDIYTHTQYFICCKYQTTKHNNKQHTATNNIQQLQTTT